MPSPGEDIQAWSKTAANNGTADPLINWVEGQTRASVNNSSRSELAAHAKDRDLKNGSIVTTGSADAQAFLSGLTYTSVPTGLRVKLKIGAGLTNTGSTTLNMDGIGAVLIKTTDGNNLLGGELIADDYVDLLYNGTNWIFLYAHRFFWDALTGGGGLIIGQQKFTASGTYTPSQAMECCIIEAVGGGGGGGSALGAANGIGTGAGGGSGGYSRKIATAAEIGASQVITIGAGGIGGAIGGGGGSNGGTTSVGTLCIANGGAGGGPVSHPGGAGGAAGTGDLTAAGAPGEAGYYNPNHAALASQSISGGGGSSYFGGGAANPAPSGAGVFTGVYASNYGSGGAGSITYLHPASAGGGNGSAGVVFITEFGGRGAPGRDGDPGPQGPQGIPGPAGAGTGDVLVSGTPTAGQIAEWTDASHIRGIAPPTGFTTGDAKLTLKNVADSGWVLMDDGTIGDGSSGASTRANVDCQSLFTLLWNNISDTYAPVVGGRGASAIDDWIAHKKITLTRQLGRSLTIAGAGAGLTTAALGQFDGAETHALTLSEIPAHVHTLTDQILLNMDNSTTTGGGPGVGTYVATHRNAQVGFTTGSVGSGTAVSLIQPRSFWNIMIKL